MSVLNEWSIDEPKEPPPHQERHTAQKFENSVEEIAGELGISERVVRRDLQTAFSKIRNRRPELKEWLEIC